MWAGRSPTRPGWDREAEAQRLSTCLSLCSNLAMRIRGSPRSQTRTCARSRTAHTKQPLTGRTDSSSAVLSESLCRSSRPRSSGIPRPKRKRTSCPFELHSVKTSIATASERCESSCARTSTATMDARRHRARSIRRIGVSPLGGKVLKVRWELPGRGKSGGLRIAMVAFCKRRRVVLARTFIRNQEPSDTDFAAAQELADRYENHRFSSSARRHLRRSVVRGRVVALTLPPGVVPGSAVPQAHDHWLQWIDGRVNQSALAFARLPPVR